MPSMLLAVALGVVVGLLLVGCILVFPRLLAPELPTDTLRAVTDEKDRIGLQGDRLKLQNDVRTALVQGLGGAALLAGLLFTWVQLQANQGQFTAQQDLTRRGQIADRFTKAVDQLGSPNVDIRLGGIYALEQIARDSREDRTRLATYEVLTAYVREHADAPQSASVPLEKVGELKIRAPELHAAMTVLARRDLLSGDPHLDLRRIDIRVALLIGAHLQGANLSQADLEQDDLTGAELQGADLFLVQLDRALLIGTHLEGASLSGASLGTAKLANTHLEGARLQGAHLERTNLSGAGLMGAHADSYTTWPPGFDWRKAGVDMTG